MRLHLFHFVYEYNVYCHKANSSILVSHLWQVYIIRIITTMADHLSSAGFGKEAGGGVLG